MTSERQPVSSLAVWKSARRASITGKLDEEGKGGKGVLRGKGGFMKGGVVTEKGQRRSD